ncbi:MAG: endonuclease/exonuclease/phosphatase family protein [Sulfitobacter sp.]|nr:endonuclease/exonuclease/phosphatase family protein [Sulfitobacter sp.]
MVQVFIWTLTGILVLGSLLPISKIPHGMIRGLAFPREQFCLIAAITLPFAYMMIGGDGAYWASGLLILVIVIQSIYIAKFTPFWRKQSIGATEAQRQDTSAQVSMLASNVKLSNRDYDRLIALAKERTPDVLMAIETDQAWIDALKEGLAGEFDEIVEVPRDNGYGMCLMSRLPLSDTEVRELIVKEIPSIRTTMTLRNGDVFRLYMMHPEPPVINHDTVGRDTELAKVGIEALEDPLPAIVSGDLNDVAWSTTTRLFQRLSRLLDPRVGRGFYNTFSATMPWMRWPLDHLFHDPRFRLVDMARLEKIGSDHFPIWFTLALTAREDKDISPGKADPEEREEAERQIKEERKRDREAIGSDWEDDL